MRFNIPNEKDTIMGNLYQKTPNTLARESSGYVLQGASAGNMQLGQAPYNYAMQGAIAIAGAGNTPREIGIIDRVQGINGRLSELYGCLSSLIERVDGSGSTGGGVPAANKPAPGLSNVLTDAEANLRGCLELINQLNAKL